MAKEYGAWCLPSVETPAQRSQGPPEPESIQRVAPTSQYVARVKERLVEYRVQPAGLDAQLLSSYSPTPMTLGQASSRPALPRSRVTAELARL